MAIAKMDVNAMIAKTRQYVDEKSEKSFLNTDIVSSLNTGQLVIQQEIVSYDQGYYENDAELNPVTDTNLVAGTVAGIAKYGLPEDFLSFKLVWRKDTGRPFTPKTSRERRSGNPSGLITTVTDASDYFISGNNIVFDPTPQSAIPVMMTYIYMLPQLSLGTGVSELPVWMHDWVCVEAAIDCLIQDEADLSSLLRKQSRYQSLLESTMSSRQLQQPRRVTVVEDDFAMYN